jgi:hypothetical protein
MKVVVVIVVVTGARRGMRARRRATFIFSGGRSPSADAGPVQVLEK